MRLDGSENVQIADTSKGSFYIWDDWIYYYKIDYSRYQYIGEHKLYRIKNDGTNEQSVDEKGFTSATITPTENQTTQPPRTSPPSTTALPDISASAITIEDLTRNNDPCRWSYVNSSQYSGTLIFNKDGTGHYVYGPAHSEPDWSMDFNFDISDNTLWFHFYFSNGK